jgi:hypothetical protein
MTSAVANAKNGRYGKFAQPCLKCTVKIATVMITATTFPAQRLQRPRRRSAPAMTSAAPTTGPSQPQKPMLTKAAFVAAGSMTLLIPFERNSPARTRRAKSRLQRPQQQLQPMPQQPLLFVSFDAIGVLVAVDAFEPEREAAFLRVVFFIVNRLPFPEFVVYATKRSYLSSHETVLK